MVKGVSRQVIVVRPPDTKLFEQAIFLLRDGADGGISDEALLRQPIPCPCAILLNKQDAGETVRPTDLASLAAGRPIFPISALTGEGLTPVRDFLRGFLSQPNQWQLVQERHMALARQAADRLRQAQSSLSTGAPLDLAAIDLHEALYLLGRITGDSVDEQLLDDIFSRFCVGK